MVIIIGAGLSGLLTAYHLKNAGIPFKIIEARDRIGGRIHTLHGESNTAVEMGATWFQAEHRLLIQLLKELDLSPFSQFMEGTAFFQQIPKAKPDSFQLPPQAPSYRIAGGTSQLIQTLYQKLDPDDVLLNQAVSRIERKHNSIHVQATDSFEADLVVLSLPPKLWANQIVFEPRLPADIVEIAQQTHTWMEDSIKVGLVYERPFWREKGQSGTLFSNAGPLTEFYDHSNAIDSKYALCGFVTSNYTHHSPEARKKLILAQLVLTFGEAAADFLEYHESVWSKEMHTCYPSNAPIYPHQNNGNPIFRDSVYEQTLIFSSSEVAPHFGGYMEGAVYAARDVAGRIKGFYKV